MRNTEIAAALFVIANLAGCGNPGGISDDDYAKFEQLGAPKLLYSCTTTSDSNAMDQRIECLRNRSNDNCSESAFEEARTKTIVGYAAGIGAMTTYNELLQDAEEKCTGVFEILVSGK